MKRSPLLALILLPGCAALLGTAPPVPATTLSEAQAQSYVRSRALMVPVAGVWPAQVEDTYGSSRSGGRQHEASDILAPRGTPVLAADDGRVVRAGVNRLGGNMIYATDPAELLVYYYAHLDRYAPGLRPGLLIHRGDVLGYVGTTGNAPAHVPHLHFQLMRHRADGSWYGGPPLDARPFFTWPGTPLSPQAPVASLRRPSS